MSVQRWFISLSSGNVCFQDETSSQEAMSGDYIHKNHKRKVPRKHALVQKKKKLDSYTIQTFQFPTVEEM